MIAYGSWLQLLLLLLLLLFLFASRGSKKVHIQGSPSLQHVLLSHITNLEHSCAHRVT